MPPRRRTPTPVSIDVEAVRRKLAEGKIVRVGVSRSAQFPEGGIGRVRSIGDPTIDGEEFVQVELSLNGTKDTLPFTPADLTPATRASNAAAPTILPRTTPARSVTAKATAPQPGRELPRRSSTPRAAIQDTGPLFPVMGDAARREFPDLGPTPHTSPSENAVTSLAPPPPAPRSAAAESVAPTTAKSKPARGGAKRTPAVAITIATTDTEPPQWRIEAKVGARVVLRSGSVTPARVWELVRMLDDTTLTRAVGTVLDDQRKAAQARADVLAAELAQVRAELEALPDARP